MWKLISALAVLLLSLPALAGSGYHAGFIGVQDICRSILRTRPSTVAEYCFGAADGSGNVPDFSGGNLLTDRTEFDDWTEGGTCAVTADQYRNPVNGAIDADYLDNTGGVSTDNRFQVVAAGVVAGETYTFSVSVRVNTPHVVTIRINEQGVAANDYNFAAGNFWRRIPVSRTMVGGGTGNITVLVYPGESGIATGTAYFYGAHLVENDEFRIGMGPFINPADQSITKPAFDLAPTNSPTLAKAAMQGVDGNRIEAREFNGTNQYYGKAHHASMNVFDSDHSLSMHFMGNSSTIVAWDRLFTHGFFDTDGMIVVVNASFHVAAYYNSAANATLVPCPTVAVNDDVYHTVHVVRDGDSAICALDGASGASTDVTGEGIDANRNLMIGANDTGGNHYGGQISYTRIDAEVLSDAELAYDRELFSALASNQRTNALSVTRATTAFTEFDGASMAEIAVNQPRVGGPGGGLLVEGQSQNMILQSQDFSTTWTTIAATISTDVAVAPDGKTTVDGMVGTAITNNHGVCQNQLDLTADSYVFHIWARPGDQDWIYLYLTTVANATAYFNVDTGFVGTTGAGIDDAGIESAWGGFYHAWIVITGTVAQHTVCAYSAEADGDNQFLGDASTVNTYVWQAQVENGTFPTSIVPTTTVPVTRNADSVTLDPHPVGKPEARALPEKFEPSTPADKLTVYLEANCKWSSSTDVGSTRYIYDIGGNIGTASLGRNHVFFYVDTLGRVHGWFGDDLDADHFIRTGADPIDFSSWFSVRLVLDFSDLSRMDMWVNGSNAGLTYNGNTGSETFDTTDVLFRFGQRYSGTINSFCRTRNQHVWPREIRP